MHIVPYVSVGNLSFGDKREVARKKLNSPFSTFRKVIGAEVTDSFDEIGLHLYYDNDDRLQFVELFRPADVVVCGIELLDRNVDEVVGSLEMLGYAPSPTDVGFQVDDLGVALTARNGIVEGVAAYRRGYYDEPSVEPL